MVAESARSSPAVVRSTSLERGPHRSFLADVVVEHGPRDVLGRMFLKVDTVLREAGVFVSLANCDELKAVNRQNSDSWKPLLPIFDPAVSDVTPHNTNVILGRNAAGKVVLAHATRNYQLGSTLLKDEIESLRLFYRNPAETAWPGEALHCSAPIAARTTGSVIFSGALWLSRELRGLDLPIKTMHLWRGLAVTRWMPDLTFSFMVPELVKAGLASRGLMEVDWEVEMINTPVKRGGTINAGMNWMTGDRMIATMREYVSADSARRNAQVDRIINE